MSERLTVFDIEVLNEDPSSVCSIGIVVLEDKKIVQEYYSLIRPKNLSFDKYRYRVHKIKPESLMKERPFKEVYKEIQPFFEHQIVISHDIQNDMAHLREAMKKNHISYPECKMSCTYVLAHMLLDMEKYNVGDLCDYYDIHLMNAHHALCDAKACAAILVRLLDDAGYDSLSDLHKDYHLAFGEMKSNYYRNIISPDLAKNNRKSGPRHPLDQKSIVFTGVMGTPKEILEEQTKAVHAFASQNVNTHTSYLVIGRIGYYRVRFGHDNKKIEKALELIKQGQDLKIIHEKEYLKLLQKERA